MSEENKKEYTPQEVAVAVLKKCQDLYKNSNLFKSNTAHEIEAGGEPSNDDAEAPEQLQVGEVCKEGSFSDEGKKGQKKKGEASEEKGKQPEHEEDMSEEEDKEHDAAENEADEEDSDDIEADEEPEAKAADAEHEADESEEEEAAEEADEEGKEESSEKKEKKKPFEKSEKPLAKFLAKMEVKKCGDMKKGYQGFEAVKQKATQGGVSDPAAVAAASGKKMQGMKAKKKSLNKKQGVPKDANPGVHERCVQDVKAQGHDKSSAFAICNASKAGQKGKKVKKTAEVKKFLKSKK